jgi:hypothetical protein
MWKMGHTVGTITVLSFLYVGSAFGQTQEATLSDGVSRVWQIPFASSDNTISLNVQNNSSIEASGVRVTFNNVPSWIEFKNKSADIKTLPANASSDAEFTFSVDKKAPVGKTTILTATISSASGQTWTKDINIEVSAPKHYELYNNFPNPFNPSTKIAFELPKESRVRLIIYDLLGREVAQVADAEYPAGYTELTWNGLNKNGERVSSGVYFYRISADKWSSIKKMVLLK